MAAYHKIPYGHVAIWQQENSNTTAEKQRCNKSNAPIDFTTVQHAMSIEWPLLYFFFFILYFCCRHTYTSANLSFTHKLRISCALCSAIHTIHAMSENGRVSNACAGAWLRTFYLSILWFKTLFQLKLKLPTNI